MRETRLLDARPGEEPSPFGPGNPEHPSLRYVFLRFFRYGYLAWGGPVAQIGLMHRELVERDQWITEERFRKTIALYQALPGPEANELAVYFGMLKRGRVGGLLAGLGFMLPGVVLITLLASLYVAFAGVSDAANILLYGVRPAVFALIALAFLRLARTSVKGVTLTAVAAGAVVVGVAFPDLNFLLIVAAGGVVALAVGLARGTLEAGGGVVHALVAPLVLGVATFPALSAVGMTGLVLLSAKVGLLTFGGAYTAIPFLQEGAVQQHGWITNQQFLDAFALSGMVPGPLIAVGTFVGYQAAGLPGAIVATVVIFTPAFAFTLVGHDFFERVIHEPRLHTFLLGVTAAVIGLIAVSSIPLARAAFTDVPTIVIGVAAAVAVWRKVPIPLVIFGAAVAGVHRPLLAQWGL